jgi:hypothetical protein
MCGLLVALKAIDTCIDNIEAEGAHGPASCVVAVEV